MSTCSAIQQGDEMACGRCGLRWDVVDVDPPRCLQHERRSTGRGRGAPAAPATPRAQLEQHPEPGVMRRMAADVDYRELLVKYMRHVVTEEGTTFVARIGTSGRGYFSGVTFSAGELAALLGCDGEAAA